MALNKPVVTGLFPDRASAEMAYNAVRDRGYDDDEINIVMSEDTKKRQFAGGTGEETELGNKAAEGAGVGGAIGGALGAIGAAIAAVGTTLAIPGLGLVIAGPIAAAIAGAGAGAATGGLVGALVGWNMPEERVKRYEDGVREGDILLGVKPRSDQDAAYFENTWKQHHAKDVYLGAGSDTRRFNTSSEAVR